MKRCEGCSYWQGGPSAWMGYCPLVERRTEAHDGAECQVYDAAIVKAILKGQIYACGACGGFDLSPTLCRKCGKAWR